MLLNLLFVIGFLICDPPIENNITYYQIYQDNKMIENYILPEPDGSFKYQLDVDELSHTYTAKACNERGCSDTSNPYILPTSTKSPVGIRLQPLQPR